jgi:CubicO group peptidase (beta-lactamase class C family)
MYDMMKTCFCFLLLWCAVSLASGPAPSANAGVADSSDQASSDIAARMDSLFHVLSTRKGFNGNVLIAQGGKIIYEKTFGYADLKARIPLNIESVFQLASISKQFTAMAIMILHDAGKLNFTDTVQRFFPEFPHKNITIRELLAHRSGLPEYMYFAKRYWKNKKRFMSNDDVMDMLIHRHPQAYSSPDQRYRYSNTGYVVLACIVERVAGVPFHEFLEERIFRPLGMRRTFVFNTKNMSDVKYPTLGYTRSKRRAQEDYLSGVVGDKGIYSTVEDLFRWDQALYTERLVKRKTLQQAFTPVSYDWRNDNSYGYGWRIDTLNDGSKIVYHAGWWRGYSSLFVRRLLDKTAIIVLCNKVNWSFENIGRFMGILDSAKENVSSAGGD